jgi:predicted transcriptional regulator with HTH domain
MGVILVIVSLIYIVCIRFDIGPRSLHYYITRSTPLPFEGIGGIKLGTILDEAAPIHGKTQTKDETDTFIYYEYDSGVEVAALKSTKEIVRIRIEGQDNQTTGKGIALGAGLREVKKRYGKNYYKRSEQGADIIGYIDKRNKTTLEFWLYENKVTLIRYDVKTMN